jgi:large subunit ribosomal protein L13
VKTYAGRTDDAQRAWLLVDASGRTLGRLASRIAGVLRGKHKPIYTPHLDLGDHVVVVNAKSVRLTGRKPETKRYFHHSQYPGGVRWTSIQERMEKHPERIVIDAVRGMLPKTKLGRALIKKLKVYGGPDHPHMAQQPVAWNPDEATPRVAAGATSVGAASAGATSVAVESSR